MSLIDANKQSCSQGVWQQRRIEEVVDCLDVRNMRFYRCKWLESINRFTLAHGLKESISWK